MSKNKLTVDVDGATVTVDAKPFDRSSFDDGTALELVFGDQPHSTRDNNIYAKVVTEGSPEGRYEAFDGHRVLTDLDLHSYNYLKSSYYSGSEIRKGGVATIKMNGKPVYSFFFREPEHACLKAHNVMTEIWEHPLRIWKLGEPEEKIIGRAVYYDRTPAIIKDFDGESGTLTLEAAEGSTFSPPVWWDEAQDGSWHDEGWSKQVRVDFLRSEVWWFRDAEKAIEKQITKDAGVSNPHKTAIAKHIAHELSLERIAKESRIDLRASITWNR